VGEFDLISRYFQRPVQQAVLGVGDDCALLQPRAGYQLAISSDMLVQGRHFFADVDPYTLGHKALAVNLSDLAACGAKPLAFTLALALPQVNEPWLAAFAQGMFELADQHGCELVGGDTTAGPLNICITVFGEVPVVNGRSQALLRSGAQAGDDLYVSGSIGDARLALDALMGKTCLPEGLLHTARARLETPTPRVALGLALRGLASAAIDISDGLLGDLGHLLKRSGVGASVYADQAIQSIAAWQVAAQNNPAERFDLPKESWYALALAGGDDYELLFTAAPVQRAAIQAAAQASHTAVSCIGQIRSELGLQVLDSQGQTLKQQFKSYDHFA
jgi:thiamine-monophosphate kinase